MSGSSVLEHSQLFPVSTQSFIMFHGNVFCLDCWDYCSLDVVVWMILWATFCCFGVFGFWIIIQLWFHVEMSGNNFFKQFLGFWVVGFQCGFNCLWSSIIVVFVFGSSFLFWVKLNEYGCIQIVVFGSLMLMVLSLLFVLIRMIRYGSIRFCFWFWGSFGNNSISVFESECLNVGTYAA